MANDAVKRDYVTVAQINARPDAVWRILTDGAGYAAWNPEILGIRGSMAAHARIKARVRIGSGAIRTVTMRVTTFEPPSRMVWTGGLPLGLFVGTRTFEVIPAGGATEFRMHLTMTGPLSSLIIRSVGDRQADIDSFSAALRQRVEEHDTA